MAEILSILSSGIAVSQLAGEIIVCTQKLYTFWTGLKGAPNQVGDALREIGLLSKILKEVDVGVKTEVAVESLKYCKEVMTELERLLEGLRQGMDRGGGMRQWASLKTLLKGKELGDLISRLERAKGMLSFTVSCYSAQQVSVLVSLVSCQIPVKKEVDPDCTRDTVESSESNSPSIVAKNKKPSKTTVTTRWFGIGWLQTYSTVSEHRISHELDDGSGEDIIIERRFLPAPWLRLRGLAFIQSRTFGEWQHYFRWARVVPNSSPIFEACKYGDLEEVRRLVLTRKAMYVDMSEDGWTLLHVAAAHLRPALCKFLIEKGLGGDTTDFIGNHTALAVAAICSGRSRGSILASVGSFMILDSFMIPIDNVDRPSDALDTIRILVEDGQCDPMFMNRWTETAFFSYTGPAEPFKYLLQQNHFMVDVKAGNDFGMTVTGAHLLMQWPTSPILARLAMIHAQNAPDLAIQSFPKSLQFTNLTLAVRRLRFNGASKILEETGNMIWLTIDDFLRAGADVHATDFYGRTPMALLLYKRLYHEDKLHTDLYPRLMKWFGLLRKAGYDLQKYIEEEQILYRGRRLFYEPIIRRFSNEPLPPHQIKRSMAIKTCAETRNITLSFEDTRVDIPGDELRDRSYLEALRRPFDHREVNDELHFEDQDDAEIDFFITPLKDGIQEFGILDRTKNISRL